MLIDMRIAVAGDVEPEAAVHRKQRQHVVEKSYTGSYAVFFISIIIEIHVELYSRFRRPPLYIRLSLRFVHHIPPFRISFTAVISSSISSGVPIVILT